MGNLQGHCAILGAFSTLAQGQQLLQEAELAFAGKALPVGRKVLPTKAALSAAGLGLWQAAGHAAALCAGGLRSVCGETDGPRAPLAAADTATLLGLFCAGGRFGRRTDGGDYCIPS